MSGIFQKTHSLYYYLLFCFSYNGSFMKCNWTSIWLYDSSQIWNIEYVIWMSEKIMIRIFVHVHHMNEDDDEIIILKICICYMCTIWMKMMIRLWFSKYVYVTCALYEQDDETMIHLHECMFYVHHIKFNPTAP